MTAGALASGGSVPAGYILRPADQADAQPMARLHASRLRRGWSAGEISALLDDHHVFALVAQTRDERSQLAGMVVARSVAEEAEILTLATARENERRGIAAALVTTACEQAATRNAAAIFLEVATSDEAARALYQRCGFREVGHRPRYYGYEENGDAVVLRRTLKEQVDGGAGDS